jgi:hypothetical protein
MKKRKLLQKILSGSKNIRFDEFAALLEALGFTLDRVGGSHRVYKHPKVPRSFPIQDINGKAKAYQVRQLLQLMELYNLTLEDDSDEDGEE